MINNDVKISIVIPCYNQAQYLPDALESVLAQTFSNWECIIVNDGSPDNTKEVAETYIQKESRFRYIEKINGGLASARNYGIEYANGEYILPLDADDRISPNYTEFGLDLFRYSNVKVVYGRGVKFGAENCDWQLPPFNFEKLLFANMIHCAGIFKKNSWYEVGGYDPKMVYGFEDWEFWINVLQGDGKAVCVDEMVFYYRVKEKSMLKDLTGEQQNLLCKYVYLKHSQLYDKYFINPLALYKENKALYKENKALKASINKINRYKPKSVLKGLVRRLKRLTHH